MPTFTTSREATKDEMGREIDRCHKVIAELEAALAAEKARAEAAEAEAAKPPMLVWAGGTRPVSAGQWVEIELRGGTVLAAPAGHFNWTHDPERPSNSDIVKWRRA